MKSFERDEEMFQLLARGEQEIEAGKGYTLEAVMAEAEALLNKPTDEKLRIEFDIIS